MNDVRYNLPLVVTRFEAAEMCRISVDTFDDWVRKGILPRSISGTRRWSRIAIEHALSGEVSETPVNALPSPFEEWKSRRAN
jgi:hypothetical protein